MHVNDPFLNDTYMFVFLSSLAKLNQTAMVAESNPDAKRLYDDLLSNYNKLVRPVANVSDALTVKIKLKLSQLIDVVTNSISRPIS